MDSKIEYFEAFHDARGDLMVFLKNKDLKKTSKTFGQIYFVTFEKKGTVRANHYHKKLREWVAVIYGSVKIILKDIKSGEAIHS